MRAVPTAEQEMLRETAMRASAAMAVNTPADLAAFDADAAWSALRDLGFLDMRARDEGAPFATGYEASLAVEALGGALSPAPLLGHLLAYELLVLAEAPQDMLEGLAEGRVRFGLLLADDLVGLSADGSGFAFDADGADWVLGLSRQGGATHLVRHVAAGVRIAGADLTRPLVRLEAATGDIIGAPLSDDALTRWTALALALTTADAVGVMRAGLAGVVEYAQQRVQYDALIGTFQAVQHMCADMLVQIEAAASAVRHAAWTVDALAPDAALKAARTAKAYVGPAGQFVCETVMQAYGGIGQTWEHVAHLRTRRVMLDRQLFGDESLHLPLLADLAEVA